jgi:aminoglycoside phosphotransferase (APT) family kinase protein
MSQHAPAPSADQLGLLADAIGVGSLTHSRRIEGGLGCTTDVLSDGRLRYVLRRYGPWYAERGEDPAIREARALELAQKANIPAPALIWIDNSGLFEQRAVVISYIDGAPNLTPSHPFDWAEQLAATLVRIHGIMLDDEDRELFSGGAGEDLRKVEQHPELVLEHPMGEELLRRRLQLLQHRVDTGPVFSHTDYWPGNTLWNKDELVAVIDWESPATGDREMDVAYCSLDIRYLGMDRVADRFIDTYRDITGETLPNLAHWEAVGLCRPMPDIAKWVPSWIHAGRDIDEDTAREQHTRVITDFLERTG